MLYPAPVVGVGDVNKPICGLDHRGIGVLSPLVFQDKGRLPLLAIGADRHVEHLPSPGTRGAPGGVVVNEQVAAIAEGDSICPRVRIRERGRGHLTPGLALVRGPGLGEAALPAAAESLQSPAGVTENGWLDRTEASVLVDNPCAGPGFSKIPGKFKMDLPAGVLGR